VEDTQARQKHIDRKINHVYHGCKSECLTCLVFRQGQIRSKGPKRRAFVEISGNARRRHRGGQSWYGCAICDIPIRNNETRWYFYHSTRYILAMSQ
jgi:hypothetical protein